MARAVARYFFGRINFMTANPNSGDLLPDGLQSGIVLPRRGQRWQFLQVSTITNELGVFYNGYLGKYKPEAEEEVAVPEKREIGDATVENRITAKARFFVHAESHLIAYHPVAGLITRRSFCAVFAELLEGAFDNFFIRAEIQDIDDENQLRDAIAALSQISRIRIRLHPSNPNTRDIWRRADERLRLLGASDYAEEYRAARRSGGLRIEDDADINAKLAMAEDGYGWAEVSGTVDDQEQVVSTDDHPVSAPTPGGAEDPSAILEHLLARFREIIGRFRT